MRIIRLAITMGAAASVLAGCGLVGGNNAADSNNAANISEDNGADSGNLTGDVSNNASVDSGGGDAMNASRPPSKPSRDTDEQSSSGVVLKPGPSKN